MGPTPATLATSRIPTEEVIQFSFSMHKTLRKELARLADGADMPMRAYVLFALRGKGLYVTDEDLVDQRKQRGRER